VQFVGDISYSLYLWHWPAIVFAPFVLAGPPAAVEKLLLLAGCVVLAWLTKVAVEQPAQRWRLLARPRTTAGLTAVAMAVVSGVAALQWHEVEKMEDAARDRLAAIESGQCFGAAAVAAGPEVCSDPYGPPASLTVTADDEPWFRDEACVAAGTQLVVHTCRWSDEPPAATVALVGDSHAEQWRGAIHRLGEELNWEVVEILRARCPVTTAPVLSFNGGGTDTEDCQSWGRQVIDHLNAEAPDYIFASGWAGAMTFGSEDPEQSLEIGGRAFADTWRGWADRGSEVFVLRDVPTTGGRWVPECLATHPGAPEECTRPRAEAVTPDALTVGAAQAGSDRVQLIDLTDFFCDETTCYAAIGGAIVYFDRDHMTAQFSRSLAPYLLERIGGGER
jgi:hypothetical protein